MSKFKLMLIFTLILIAYALTSCASAAGSNKAEDLAGSWKMQDGTDAFDMSASVTAGSIEILWIADGGASLYWKGTFPRTAIDGKTVMSRADAEALDKSLFGSSDSHKDFVYKDGTLSFKMTAMGTEKTVVLEKK